MRTTHLPDSFDGILKRLEAANVAFAKAYPGDSPARQPVQTVYGGAQIFKADTAQKLGAVALRSIQDYAPTPAALAKALGVRMEPALARRIFERVVAKLEAEPVEDFRIDFEDGYGNRPDAEEDGHAVFAAGEVAAGMASGTLPPFIGIRVKPLTHELKYRALRTLDLFLTTLAGKTGGRAPENFVITLPKVVIPDQVAAFVDALETLEKRLRISSPLKVELMIETPQSIINERGECNVPLLVAAARGRCKGAHFGVYDYTASNNITAAYQSMTHEACDFARHMMKVSLAGTGVWISDGATNIMPVGPHRAAQGKKLTPKQAKENRDVVHRSWRIMWEHVNHSLVQGYYQGWDLHPAQFPVRYAAVYRFFLEGLDAASVRLKTFIEKAAQATLIGDVFDDAATGQGLLNFFLRGINCGAITEDEARGTGLTIDELHARSFVKIMEARRRR
jgi:citrate lyase beta subunit